MSYVTTLSVDVEAVLELPTPSVAAPATTLAMTVPLQVWPETETVYVVPEPVTVLVGVPDAVPLMTTSLASKPVTGSLNTTVKRIGNTSVGSACPAA